MRTSEENDTYHREHPYTLPSNGDVIVSPITGTAYFIGKVLAQGSFSHVFFCTDDWEHDLAAKVLKPIGEWQDTQERALFEVLAQSIGRSPHIVQVFDTFIYKGAYYIISERCARTLQEMMSTPYRPNVWFPSLAKAVLHALHFMHTQGLGHCDVHPGNMFSHFIPDPILPEEAASVFKLGDFGLTRPLEALSPEGTFHKCYRPPEAINPVEFGPIDHRSDIYQAGMLLLSFLAQHERKFTTVEVLAGRPRDLAESLQHPANEVIAKMLRRHSQSRPPNALEAWRELRLVLQPQ